MSRRWRIFWIILGLLFAIALVFAVRGYREARSYGFFRAPVFETIREELPALPPPAVMVFSKTSSFIHKEAIPAAREALLGIAADRDWSVYVTDSGAIYNTEDLSRFDVIVWNNVTGDVLLPEQRSAMRNWLEQGGGFVGLHSAGDDSHDVWPWYQDTVIRAHFVGHPIDPQFQQATLRVEQPADTIVAPLANSWTHLDEWYSFAASPRAPDLLVLLTIDESSYRPGTFFGRSLAMGDDHPMAWKHCVAQGRAIYLAPGHTAETYVIPEYREVLARAIAWAGSLDSTEAAGPNSLACERDRKL